MAISRKTQKTTAETIGKELPLMDLARIKAELVAWLGQIKFPGYAGIKSWDEHIRVFPSEPTDIKPSEGLRIRLSVTLKTINNRYLISILESYEPRSRGTYFICVHTDWKIRERRLHKRLEEKYRGLFSDDLQARHVIWAQNFRDGELYDGLNACAAAILGNELSAETAPEDDGQPVARPDHQMPIFLSTEKDSTGQ